jgi:hypothetical protein
MWLLPGMAAIAGAESDAAVRRRIAAATAVTTTIVIAIQGLMVTTHVACQPVSRVEELPTVLTVAVPAGVITWALMRIGGALTVRFGWGLGSSQPYSWAQPQPPLSSSGGPCLAY